MKITARVLKYDPHSGEDAFYRTYEVPYQEGMTLLDLLRAIYEHQDGTLCFRSSCGIGKCGSCAVSMNGREVLSCRKILSKNERDLVIEPLRNFPVIKDLVVDRERFDRRLTSVLVSSVDKHPGVRLLPPRNPKDPTQPACIECLCCEAACPVMTEMADHFLGPALISAFAGMRLLSGLPRAVPDSGLADSAFCCLHCERCTVSCPAHLPLGQSLLSEKRDLAKAGKLPEALGRLSTTISRTGNISGDDNEMRLVWSGGQEASVGQHTSEAPEIVYYVGCLSSFYPSTYAVPQSFTRVLETAGARYHLMGDREWCCGYPFLLNGLTEEVRNAAKRNIQAVRDSGATKIVTTCPSCYYTWREIYPSVSEDMVEFEVVHATEYLVELMAQNRLPLRGRISATVTYHDPCDLGRKSGVFEAPRRLLTALSPEVTLVEMKNHHEHALCCGGGGNVQSFQPDLTEAVSSRRVKQAAETGADILATACPQCERVLRQAARKRGIPLQVVDVVQLVADSLEGSAERTDRG